MAASSRRDCSCADLLAAAGVNVGAAGDMADAG